MVTQLDNGIACGTPNVEMGYINNNFFLYIIETKTPFLQDTHLVVEPQDLPGRFKEEKACSVDMKQMGHKL